ncbi:MAG: response regulator transcription factor [Bryobacteraceae bacterium]
MPAQVFACVQELVYLKGLEAAFAAQSEFDFPGGCVDPDSLQDRLRSQKVDVLLYDLTSEHHLLHLGVFRRNFPELHVVALVNPPFERFAQRIAERGATSCLRKTATADDLFVHLREITAYGRMDASSRALTEREKDVLRLVARGFANKQIARELLVSELTVKSHLNHIYQKLRVNGRVRAAVQFLGGSVSEDRAEVLS